VGLKMASFSFALKRLLEGHEIGIYCEKKNAGMKYLIDYQSEYSCSNQIVIHVPPSPNYVDY
jgi:hypothetical protein